MIGYEDSEEAKVLFERGSFEEDGNVIEWVGVVDGEDGAGIENESMLHGEIRVCTHGQAGNNVHCGLRQASLALDCWKKARGDVNYGTWRTEMDLRWETKKAEERSWGRVFHAPTDCYLDWDGVHTQDVVG